jgi:hypothetical protein
MSDSVVRAVLAAAGLYALVGLLFAGPFVARGVERLDPAARGGTWGFRLILVPGVMLLWPWLWVRLRAVRGGRP